MAAEPLLVSYLLRVVRIGVVCTFVVVAAIAVYPLLGPTVPLTNPTLYWAVVIVAPIGAAGVAALPWRRMLSGRWPLAGFHLWSVGDIVLISLSVVASGGILSPLWSVYTLTTLFFAASYPRRSQIALFAFTVLAYIGAIAVTADAALTALAGDLVLRIGVLLTIALMAGFISAELTRQMSVQARRARASAKISAAAAQVGTFDLDRVMESAVEAAQDIGLPISAVILFEGKTYRIVASSGLPDDFEPIRLIVNEPPEGNELWVLKAEEVADPEIAALLDEAGCDVVLAAPLSFVSAQVGVFAAAANDDPASREAVQTLGMLITQAMENAELYRLKTDFVANVSHELRTPLTVLVGMGQTLRRHAPSLTPEQLADLSERIDANASRLSRLITDLLDFSRLEAGRGRLEREPVDMSSLVAATVQRREEELEPRQIILEIEDDVVAMGDESMIQRVVDSILLNVAVHTPPTATARVIVSCVDDDVEVAVADDGPGIPDGARAADHFYRGGDHLTRSASGLGLGLTLADEILALHGSELHIGRSELGGALVTFRLPARVSGEVSNVATPASGTEA